MLSSTSPCELSEREVTAPSNLKVVIALGCHELSVNYVSPYIVLVWFFLPGEVEDNMYREKWGDFWDKLIAINRNIVPRPLPKFSK
jgi:hypothetical protein